MAIYQAINSHLEGDIEKIAKEMCLEINNFGFRILSRLILRQFNCRDTAAQTKIIQI